MGGERSCGRSSSRDAFGCGEEVRISPLRRTGFVGTDMLYRARLATRRQLTIDWLDISLPASSIGLVNINEGALGILGYVFGLLSQYPLLNSYALFQSYFFDPRGAEPMEIGARCQVVASYFVSYVIISWENDALFVVIICTFYLYSREYFPHTASPAGNA